MGKESLSADTRRRLLEAALDVFAQRGYREATFREICRLAGANNAAINYHFRDKEQLYLAVIEYAFQKAEALTGPPELDPAMPPEERLRVFVHAFLTSLLGEQRPAGLLQLFSREMIEPTHGLALLLERGHERIRAQLGDIVAELLGDGAEALQIEDCVRAIMAQCVIFHHSRAAILHLGHYPRFDAATIEHLTSHVVEFSLGGLRRLAEERAAASAVGGGFPEGNL